MIHGEDINSLMSLRQNLKESIRDFIKWFTKEMIEAENVDLATVIAAVIKAVRFQGLKDLLIKFRAKLESS